MKYGISISFPDEWVEVDANSTKEALRLGLKKSGIAETEKAEVIVIPEDGDTVRFYIGNK